MRIRTMPLLLSFVFVGFLSPSLSRASDEGISTPQAYAWCPLEHFAGRVLIPTGWFNREIHGPDGTGYQMTKEVVAKKKGDFEAGYTNSGIDWSRRHLRYGADHLTGFSIKVIRGPLWSRSRLSDLAEGIYADYKNEGRVSALADVTVGTYRTLSFDLDYVETIGHICETQHLVELILLDTATPTMVIAKFDCPARAWSENKDCCEKILTSLSLFQGVMREDHSPYPPATKAAVAGDQAPP